MGGACKGHIPTEQETPSREGVEPLWGRVSVGGAQRGVGSVEGGACTGHTLTSREPAQGAWFGVTMRVFGGSLWAGLVTLLGQ